MSLANDFARIQSAATSADGEYFAKKIDLAEYNVRIIRRSNFIDDHATEIEHALRAVEQLRAEIAATVDFPSSFRDRVVAILGDP